MSPAALEKSCPLLYIRGMRRDDVIARLKQTEPKLRGFGVGALAVASFSRRTVIRGVIRRGDSHLAGKRRRCLNAYGSGGALPAESSQNPLAIDPVPGWDAGAGMGRAVDGRFRDAYWVSRPDAEECRLSRRGT